MGIDFDMARSYGKWERHFETQELVGTKSLMSPECAYVGNPARAKSNDVQCETSFWNADRNDVWCFGMLVFCLIIGCPPFTSCSNKKDTRFLVASGSKYVTKKRKAYMNYYSMTLRDMLEQWNKSDMV